MTKAAGTRNREYASRRAVLVDRLRTALGSRQGTRPSLRDLAREAGVGVSTLRHYFGDREGLVEAVLEDHRELGAGHMAWMAEPGDTFGQSIHDAARYLLAGFRDAVGAELVRGGLVEGLMHEGAGTSFLRDYLEPALQSVERRLAGHMARGDMRAADPRTAALTLVAPIMLAALHQDALGGDALRPLDLSAVAHDAADSFVRAFASQG